MKGVLADRGVWSGDLVGWEMFFSLVDFLGKQNSGVGLIVCDWWSQGRFRLKWAAFCTRWERFFPQGFTVWRLLTVEVLAGVKLTGLAAIRGRGRGVKRNRLRRKLLCAGSPRLGEDDICGSLDRARQGSGALGWWVGSFWRTNGIGVGIVWEIMCDLMWHM